MPRKPAAAEPTKPAAAEPKSRLAEVAPAMTGIGSLLVGVAAVLALIVSGRPADGGTATPLDTPVITQAATAGATGAPSATAAAASVVPATGVPTAAPPDDPATPVFGKVAFTASLREPVDGLGLPDTGTCTGTWQDGLRLATTLAGEVCGSRLSGADSALLAVADVRIQATAEFTDFTLDKADQYGPGDAALQCRLHGLVKVGSSYIASIGPTGYWEIDRFDDGEQKHLLLDVVPPIATAKGGTRLLQLDCYGDPGGPTTVAFSVDGTELGRYTDPNGLPAGDVALSSTNYSSRPHPMTVTFSGLRVLLPSP